LVMYEDLSGTSACFWGEYRDEPGRKGWFDFYNHIGDYRYTEEAIVGDDSYGWLPFPEPIKMIIEDDE
jgi:hypothetical protein